MANADEVTTVVSEIPSEEAAARWEIRGFSRLDLEAPQSMVRSKTLVRVSDAEFVLGLQTSHAGTAPTRPIQVVLEIRTGRHAISFTKEVFVLHKGQPKYIHREGNLVTKVPKDTIWTGLWDDFATYEQLRANSDNNILVLQLEVEVWLTNGLEHLPSQPPPTLGQQQLALSQDFEKLLREGDCTDVELCLKGSESLRAHRLVLATRSPVFKSMLLSSGMSESVCNSKVQMIDVELDIARVFLQYIYTDNVSPTMQADDEMMCHLLALAHKYEIQSLVGICAAAIAAKLSVANACERLMMADMLGVSCLKQMVLCFATNSKERFAEVQSTEGYARLVQQRPHILADILAKSDTLVTKKRPPEPAALPADLDSLTIVDLKRLLSDRGLPTSGNKQALVNRLRSG